jgi:hypothetical protein
MVSVVTSYRLDSLGFESQQQQEIFTSTKYPDQFWGQPSFLFDGYWVPFLGIE